MRVAFASAIASKEKCRAQFAALPWRVANGSLEVLLITTLKTRRWIVPKGWPIDELAPHACADPAYRYQHDLDFLVSRRDAERCRAAVERHGYQLTTIFGDTSEFRA